MGHNIGQLAIDRPVRFMAVLDVFGNGKWFFYYFFFSGEGVLDQLAAEVVLMYFRAALVIIIKIESH